MTGVSSKLSFNKPYSGISVLRGEKMRKVIALGVLGIAVCWSSCAYSATYYYNDGQTHDIMTYVLGPRIIVDNENSGPPTTINILSGGSVHDILMYNESTLNLIGGTVRDEIHCKNSSLLNFESGLVKYNIHARNNSIVNMTGGVIKQDIVAGENAEITFSNGSIGRISTYNNSSLYISSGTIQRACFAFGDSQIIIYGGTFNNLIGFENNGNIEIHGGVFNNYFRGCLYAKLYFHGSDFSINGNPVSYGQYYSSDFASGDIMGTLQNGDSLNSYFQISNSSSIILVDPTIEVPIDIKPISCPNPLNVKSSGVLPVAILGTEDVNVTEIDVATILLEGVSPIRSALEDVATPVTDVNDCNCTTDGPDGFLDLTLKFNIQEIVTTFGEVNHGDELTLTLEGALLEEFCGTLIYGADCVTIRGKHKPLNVADINKDGVVDTVDFAIFAKNWLQSSIIDD